VRGVLVDSSFWIALRSADEPHHASARRAAAALIAGRRQWVVTSLIFAEVHARFARHPVRRGQIIRDFWENPIVHHEAVSHADQLAAIELLRRHRDKAYSFCDAVSFVVIQRLDLTHAASYDDHFRQIGQFEVID
jgi:predicted nucleic acid-binding protein